MAKSIREPQPKFKPIIIEGIDPWTSEVKTSRRAESKYAAKVIRESIRNMGYELRERGASHQSY